LGCGERTELEQGTLVGFTAQRLPTQLQRVGWFWGCAAQAFVDWGVGFSV
jgi:hypothetical protein